MKLFTKQIDDKLYSQFDKGSDLSNQKVVAKLFNPYGRGTWYLINSDPSDPDYIWAIVDLYEIEVGSVSRAELQNLRVPPYKLPLERDMSFIETNAQEVLKGLRNGKTFAEGGDIADQNKEMLENQAVQLRHHTEELMKAIEKSEDIEPWVITKAQRAATDLSDITHYLDGANREEGEDDIDDYDLGGKLEPSKALDAIYKSKDELVSGLKYLDPTSSTKYFVLNNEESGDWLLTQVNRGKQFVLDGWKYVGYPLMGKIVESKFAYGGDVKAAKGIDLGASFEKMKRNTKLDDYEAKFITKMSGSTEQSAAYWVDGIGGLSNSDKKELFARVNKYTIKEEGQRDMPEWYADGGMMEQGGKFEVGRFYKNKEGKFYRYLGSNYFMGQNGQYKKLDVDDFYKDGGNSGDFYDDMNDDIDKSNEKAKRVYSLLKSAGYNPSEISEADYDVDASITLSDKISLSISLDTNVSIVIEVEDGKFQFIDAGKSNAALLKKLKEVMPSKSNDSKKYVNLTLTEKGETDYTYTEDGTENKITFAFGKSPFTFDVKKISPALKKYQSDIIDAFTIQGIRQKNYPGGFKEAIQKLDTSVVEKEMEDDEMELGGYMSGGGEAGAANIIIKLSNGIITVKHHDGSELLSWKAKKGDWMRIWNTFNLLGEKKENGGEAGAAEITVELKNSKITIYHSDGTRLYGWKAKSGDWNKIWEVLYELSDKKEDGGKMAKGGTTEDEKLEELSDYLDEEGIYGYTNRIHRIMMGRDDEYTREQIDDYLKDPDGNGFGIFGYTRAIERIYEDDYEKGAYMEDGGATSSPNSKFMKWYGDWSKNVNENVYVSISIPNEFSSPIKDGKGKIVILDVIEKKGDSDAKKYMNEILEKADEFGVSIYLEPIPRTHNLKSEEHKKKITKDYLIKYYQKFGFENTDGGFMVREPKMAGGGKVTFEDKVAAVKASLLKRKKVSPKVQKDYGKTYSPSEAEDSAKRIVGAMTAKERLMKILKKKKKAK